MKEGRIKKILKNRKFIVLLFALILSMILYINVRGEYLEILEIGEQYLEIFWTNIKYKTITLVVNFVFLFIYWLITNSIIKKGLKPFFYEENKKMPKLPNKSIAFIIATIISLIMNNTIVEKYILIDNSAWFGTNDPVFGRDIGFYIFQKPFIECILTYLIGILVFSTLYMAIYNIIVFNKFFDGINPETLAKSIFINQVKVNAMIVSIIIAFMILIKTQNILFSKFINIDNSSISGIYGAGNIDVTIKLWGYRILALILCISIFLGIKYINKKSLEKVLKCLMMVPIYLVILFGAMVTYRFIFLRNNEFDKERQYISYNIEYTKNAYDINIDEIEIENNGTIKERDIENYKNVINNIPILNSEIVLKTLNNLQTSTGYYTFNSSKIENYKINGKNTLLFISPREIISNGNRTYNSKTYEYTHGFSIVASFVNKINQKGEIQYLQKDISEQSNNAINIEEPRIYFSKLADSTIVTNSNKKEEFDYPDATNEYSYTGDAGLKLNFLDRLILGINKNDIRLAFSTNIDEESKILINRNIRERAKILMPYLLYDEEPYMIITDDGKLVWVLDAYTISDKYPYSTPTIIEYEGFKESINYIRNSVKVIIDSFSGEIKFYITDKTDPIIMAYKNIYPSLFEDSDIPEEIANHIVYSEFMYNIQSEMLKVYHKTTPEVLYRADDVWDFAKRVSTITTSTVSLKGTYMEPYYSMIKTDEEKLGLIIPYTIANKQNLNSYLVGTYENKNSKLTLYKFADNSNILGTMQLEQQIIQDETISKEILQVNIAGVKITKDLYVIPIGDKLLYVEPIYQTALNEPNAYPVIKKVIVASGNKVAIGNNLESAIENLISQSALDIEIEETETKEEIISAIIKANQNLESSGDNKDWEMMGRDLQKLQSLIKKLEEVRQKEIEEQKNKVISFENEIR